MGPEKNSDETDEEIIELYKRGDREAFRGLIERYISPLYNFAARKTSPDDASDIVQDIFIKVWKNIGRFDQSKASFKTWIFTVGRNTITDFLRKKRSLLFSDIRKSDGDDAPDDSFLENIPDEQLLSDAALQKIQDKELLNALLDKMKPGYREILLLHYQEEMTFDEIGEVLSKSMNTVKSGHRRAIIELRKMLSDN
jgi:RNA polymerase sigma-70 factor (ECF subfamily)